MRKIGLDNVKKSSFTGYKIVKPDLPRVDGCRCRLGVHDGVQEGDVRVVGEGVEGDAVDGGQRKGVQSSQVEKPVATDNTDN